MDLNYKKYGYDIPDMSMPNLWTKNDGTDISSMKDAVELSNKLQSYLSQHEDPRPSFDLLVKDMSSEKYYQSLIQFLKEKH